MTGNAVGVVSSDQGMGDVARDVLERGGTATDACVAAFLMGGAQRPGVLMGALQLILSGPGVGAHVYDGSLLQPGKGAPRPRGYVQHQDVPDAARIAVSTSISALAAAYAFDGTMSMSELASDAVRKARSVGAGRRAKFIQQIVREGPLSLRHDALKRAMLDIAARAQGGNLTDDDIEQASARTLAPDLTSAVMSVPVEQGAAKRDHAEVLRHVLLVTDRRGVFGGVVAQSEPTGVSLDDFELTLSRWAVPVMRGVPRVSPGAVLQVPVALGILVDAKLPWGAVYGDCLSVPSWDRLSQLSKAGSVDFGGQLDGVLRSCCPKLTDYWALVRLGASRDRLLRAYSSMDSQTGAQ